MTEDTRYIHFSRRLYLYTRSEYKPRHIWN